VRVARQVVYVVTGVMPTRPPAEWNDEQG